MAPNRNLAFALALGTALLLPLGGCVPTSARAQVGSVEDSAFRQQAVDNLVARIASTIDTSFETAEWRDRYKQAMISIEDLKKTLSYGGEIRSDPIAPFKAELDGLWVERYEYWTYLQGTLIQLLKRSKDVREQTVRDIGGAMIRFLTSPKPGLGTLANSARSSDAATIKNEFSEIRSIERLIKVVRSRIDTLKQEMLLLKARREELVPVHAAFKALTGSAQDGAFRGKMTWEQANAARPLDGSLKFTVTGDSFKGDFEIEDGRSGDQARVQRKAEIIEGKIFADGRLEAKIRGGGKCVRNCDDVAGIIVGALLAFPFSGKLEGRITGGVAEGHFDVHSTDQRSKQVNVEGRWKATRKEQ